MEFRYYTFQKYTCLTNISNLQNLTYLKLQSDYLYEIDGISELKNLETLFLNECSFETIPDEMLELCNLKKLHLKENEMEYLPTNISKLENFDLVLPSY